MLQRTAARASQSLPRTVTLATRPRVLLTPHRCAQRSPTTRRLYHEKVLDHYQNPRNVGSMSKSSPDVGTGLVGAPACGDVMKLQIKVDPDTQEILEAKFKTFGCGSAIASSSYMTELVKGMTLDQAGKIKNTEIAQELCLPPVKLHCSMLAQDAIASAIKDYRGKSRNRTTTDLGGTAAKLIPDMEAARGAAPQTIAAA